MALLPFALKRLTSRAALNLLYLASLALIIGVVIAVPVFSEGAGRSIVEDELAVRTQNLGTPSFSLRFYEMPSSRQPMSLEQADYVGAWMEDALRRQVGLRVTQRYFQYESPAMQLRAQPGDARYSGREPFNVRVVYVPEIVGHITAVGGDPFGAASEGNLPVWIANSFAAETGLQVGDSFNLVYLLAGSNRPVPATIRGLFEQADPSDRFWYREAARSFSGALLTSHEAYESHVAPLLPQGTGFNYWYYVLDDARMNLDHADRYAKGIQIVERDFIQRTNRGRMDFSPAEELLRGQARKVSLSTLLYGFGVPLLAILALFMAAMAGIVARYQTQETAMLVSRGTSSSQMIGLVVLEAAILFVLAVGPGALLGISLANLLTASQGFVAFGEPLPMDLRLGTTRWSFVLLVGLVSVLFRLVPSLPSRQLTLVTYERRRARTRAVLTGARLFVMVLLAGTAAYAYRQLAQKGTLMIGAWQAEGRGIDDPLALVAPLLYLLSVPLVASEVFTVFARLLALIWRFIASSSAYIGFLHLGREGGQYRTPVYLLTFTLTVGVFYASIAKSADVWMIDRRRYEVGADLTFEPTSRLAIELGEPDPVGSAFVVPADEYERVRGVLAATRVVELTSRVATVRNAPRMRLLGTEYYSFPRVAYYRPDLSDQPLQGLMNALAAHPNGLLVPADLDRRLQLAGLKTLSLNMWVGEETVTLSFDIVGTFDYFPTMVDDVPVVVANQSYLDQEIGLPFPHRVWLRLQPGVSDREVLAGLDLLGMQAARVRSAPELIAQDRSSIERVGIFGVLTVSFLWAAFFSAAGYLVYILASMRGRGIRFAVLQAIGMFRGQLRSMVLIEDMTTILYGLVAGVGLGLLGSELYVPFYAITERPVMPVPPFLPQTDWLSTLHIALVMGLVLFLGQLTVLLHVRRTRVFEALRLGARE